MRPRKVRGLQKLTSLSCITLSRGVAEVRKKKFDVFIGVCYIIRWFWVALPHYKMQLRQKNQKKVCSNQKTEVSYNQKVKVTSNEKDKLSSDQEVEVSSDQKAEINCNSKNKVRSHQNVEVSFD